MKDFPLIYSHLNRTPLLITQQGLEEVFSILQAHQRGEKGDIRRATEIREQRLTQLNASIAGLRAAGYNARYIKWEESLSDLTEPTMIVVPFYGVVASRASWMDETSGMVSPQRLASLLTALRLNGNVSSVVLDVSSPGGDALGTAEAADAYWELSQAKDTMTYTSDLAASAAVYIGSQGGSFYASKDAWVGSIGVISAHYSYAEYAKKMGLDVTYFRSSPAKARGQMFEPMTDELKAEMEQEIQIIWNSFVEAVARGRGMTMSQASQIANGEIWPGSVANSLGLIDGVAASLTQAVKMWTSLDPVEVDFSSTGQSGGKVSQKILAQLGVKTEDEALDLIASMKAKEGQDAQQAQAKAEADKQASRRRIEAMIAEARDKTMNLTPAEATALLSNPDLSEEWVTNYLSVKPRVVSSETHREPVAITIEAAVKEVSAAHRAETGKDLPLDRAYVAARAKYPSLRK